jgi:hypothetical protein
MVSHSAAKLALKSKRILFLCDAVITFVIQMRSLRSI